MYEDEFPVRLAILRNQKGVSAREMSLAIGQNAGYINNIESGKAFPSMQVFFYICEYLEITPRDFFESDCLAPQTMHILTDNLKKLNENQLENISSIVKDLANK